MKYICLSIEPHSGSWCGAVMDSYNPVNGVYATQNDYLNNQVLRKTMGIDGICYE